MSDAAVVSSPTPSSPAASPDLASLTADQRDHWRLTGDWPDAKPASEQTDSDPDPSLAASTPAAPDAQAVSTETSTPPASEPGTPKKANADTRKAELRQEIETLLAERDRLRDETARLRPSPTATKPAESSPATESLAQVLQAPDPAQPELAEDVFFQRFPDATVGQYARYLARYEIALASAQSSVTVEKQTRMARYVERMESALTADPDFWGKQHPAVRDLKPLDHLQPHEQPTGLNYAAQEILLSDKPAELVAHFSAHPEDLTRLARGTWADAVRAVARIRATLDLPSVPEKPVVAKTTTSAPPPPSTLGTKPVQSADEAEAALSAGDFRRYRTVMNRREMAS